MLFHHNFTANHIIPEDIININENESRHFHTCLLDLSKSLHLRNYFEPKENIQNRLNEIESRYPLFYKERGIKLEAEKFSLIYSPGFLRKIFLNLWDMGLDVTIIFDRISNIDKENLLYSLMNILNFENKIYSINIKKMEERKPSNIVKIFLLIIRVQESNEKIKLLNYFANLLNGTSLNGSSEIAIEDIFLEIKKSDTTKISDENLRSLFGNIYFSSLKDKEFQLQSILNDLDFSEDDVKRTNLLLGLLDSNLQTSLSRSIFDFFLMRARLNPSPTLKIISMTTLAVLSQDSLSKREYNQLIESSLDLLNATEFEFSDENTVMHIARASLISKDAELIENALEIINKFLNNHDDSDFKIESYIHLYGLLQKYNYNNSKYYFLSSAIFELELINDISYKCHSLRTIAQAYLCYGTDTNSLLDLYESLEKVEIEINTVPKKFGIEELFSISEAFYILKHEKKSLSLFQEAVESIVRDETNSDEFYSALSDNFHFLNPNDSKFEMELIEIFIKHISQMKPSQDRRELVIKFINIILKNDNFSDNLLNIFKLLEFFEFMEEEELDIKCFLPFADKLRRMGMVEASVEFYQKIINY
jgi:hypothetical protein